MRLSALLLSLAVAMTACTGPSPRPVPPAPGDATPHLTIGVGFEALGDVHTLEDRLDEVGAAGVSIAVGRPDWVAFAWEEQPDATASRDDRVAHAIEHLGTRADGTPREVTLVIDALAPRLIADDEDLAGVWPDGEVSDLLPGATAWAQGEVGERIGALCGTLAQRYSPDRIALTELLLDATFSDVDLAAYRAATGARDWPRTRVGAIDTAHPSLDRFRADAATALTERCAERARPHGAEVDVDVRVNWDAPGSDRLDSGHAYDRLLDAGGRLTLWNYFALNDRAPADSAALAEGLARRFGPDLEHVTVSVGLWAGSGGDNAAANAIDGVVTPAAMAAGVEASLTHGVRRVSVTPASLMTDEHWAALAALELGG